MGCAKVPIGPPHQWSMTSAMRSKSALVMRRTFTPAPPRVPRLTAFAHGCNRNALVYLTGGPRSATSGYVSPPSPGTPAVPPRVLLAPSIHSADFGRLADEVRAVEA